MTSVIFNFCANQVVEYYKGHIEKGTMSGQSSYHLDNDHPSYIASREAKNLAGSLQRVTNIINIPLSILDAIGIIALFVIGFLNQNHFIQLPLNATSNWIMMGAGITGFFLILLSNIKCPSKSKESARY